MMGLCPLLLDGRWFRACGRPSVGCAVPPGLACGESVCPKGEVLSVFDAKPAALVCALPLLEPVEAPPIALCRGVEKGGMAGVDCDSRCSAASEATSNSPLSIFS